MEKKVFKKDLGKSLNELGLLMEEEEEKYFGYKQNKEKQLLLILIKFS